MADWTKEEIFDIITEYEQTYGSAIGPYRVRELTQEELTSEVLEALTIPSMMPSTEEWVQTSLRNMMVPINTATSDLTTLKQQTIAAKDAALDAAGSVETAVTAAGNVNATLVGMTVTVTNRNGQSTSVNIGFEIAPNHVYASKSAMIADAANVQAGQFCMIATTDTTSTDNATLWSRNSQPASAGEQAFTFLSDLDQASSSAWADWMDNQRPLIIQATSDANAAALLANTKAGLANDAAALANTKAGAANDAATFANTKAIYANDEGDYAKAQGDLLKAWNEHQPFIGNGTTGDENYWYIWVNGAYVKSVYAKGDDLHYEEMTPAEKEELAQRVLSQLVFASVATCEDIIDELT